MTRICNFIERMLLLLILSIPFLFFIENMQLYCCYILCKDLPYFLQLTVVGKEISDSDYVCFGKHLKFVSDVFKSQFADIINIGIPSIQICVSLLSYIISCGNSILKGKITKLTQFFRKGEMYISH